MTKRNVKPPVIVEKDCIGCKRCVTICPSFVLEMKETQASVIHGDWCIECGHCEAVCPTEAVLFEGTDEKLPSTPGRRPVLSPEALDFFLRERRSIRIYTRDPVPTIMLEKIFDTGSYAPTGTNSQNVHYVVLTTPEIISALQKKVTTFYGKIFSRVRGRLGLFLLSLVAGRKTADFLKDSLPKMDFVKERMDQGEDRLFYHAPAVVLAHAESWDTCSSFNCSVALYHCSLMAHALGLGSCFNGFLVAAVNKSPKIKTWLGIPRDHQCFAAMTLGFPDTKYLRLVHRQPPKIKWS